MAQEIYGVKIDNVLSYLKWDLTSLILNNENILKLMYPLIFTSWCLPPFTDPYTIERTREVRIGVNYKVTYFKSFPYWEENWDLRFHRSIREELNEGRKIHNLSSTSQLMLFLQHTPPLIICDHVTDLQDFKDLFLLRKWSTA